MNKGYANLKKNVNEYINGISSLSYNCATHTYISGMNIGIIGLGDMGRLYAKAFAKAGYTVTGCDLPGNRERLQEELAPYHIKIVDSGKEVSQTSDLIIYSVEAEKIAKVVAENAEYTKPGAIVAG